MAKFRVITIDPECKECQGTGRDTVRHFCPCVKLVDIEARETKPNKTIWEHLEEPTEAIAQTLEMDEATYVVVMDHGDGQLYDIQCISSSSPYEEGRQFRIPAKMWDMLIQHQRNHAQHMEFFRRISLLADERVIRGDGSAFGTEQQREILGICSDAGIGISTCVGATGPTGPGP